MVARDEQAVLGGLLAGPGDLRAATHQVRRFLSQRVRIPQASALKADLVAAHGDDGAFPAPSVLLGLELPRRPPAERAPAEGGDRPAARAGVHLRALRELRVGEFAG